MAQEKEKALDEKTKKLAGGKIEEGKEHEAYQETQQQLLAIQAEQQQNLAVARAESKASFDNNQTLAQAAELGAISAAEAEQAAAAGAQAGEQLNPATQQILSKYGAGQPHFQRSQSHSQQVTKQNIIINNNITSNTSNDVKVPANVGGPLQGRPLQFRDPNTGGGSIGKFKTWISAAFARQNEEGEKRDREYRHRESSLTRSANKMMKKLGDIGKTIGSNMDPRKIGSTWQSQLKTLLLIFGFGYLTSNWTKILTQIASIEDWFKKIAKFIGVGVKDGEESGLMRTIRGLLGGEKGEGLFEMLGKLLFVGDESLLGYMKLWLRNAMEERGKAVKMIKFPQLDIEDTFGSISKLVAYLGDVMSALVSGAEGAKQHINTQIKQSADREAFKSMQNDAATRETMKIQTVINGETKTVSADKGLEALLKDKKTGKREYTGLTRYSIDSNGDLTDMTEASYSQSVYLNQLYQDAIKGKKKFNSADAAKGIERLYNAAKRKQDSEGHGIPIAEDFLNNLSSDLVEKLTREGKLKKVPYHRIVRKKNNNDYALEEATPGAMAVKAYAGKEVLNTLGLGGASNAVAAAKGAAKGLLLPGGAAGGALVGMAANSSIGRGITAYAKGAYNYLTSNDYRVEFVRGKGKNNETTLYFQEITPEGIQDIANFLSNGMSFNGQDQANIDITDRNFVDSIRSSYEVAADNYIGNLKENLKQARREVSKTPTQKNARKVKQLELDIQKSKNAKNGEDDAERKKLYGEIEELEDLEDKHRDQERDAWNNTRFSKGVDFGTETLYNISGGALGSPIKSQKEYVAMMRPLLLKTLKSKRFVPKNKVEEYADLLTTQSGLESGWGKSLLNIKYNNYSGMTAGTAKYHKAGSVTMTNKEGKDKNTYAVFRSVEDWADEYVEYLNRKWKAFDGDTTQYFNRLQHNKSGQSYATDKNYVKKNISTLARVKSIAGSKDIAKYERAMPSSDISKLEPNGQSSGGSEQEQEPENKARSFIDIFKEKVTSLLTNLGGAFGKANDVASSTANELKSKILKNGYAYKGPITKEFTDYETYLKNQDKLPADLPPGLSSTEWENRVFDMTGSFPHYQKLREKVVDNGNEDLREDSKNILSKYSKPVGEFKISANEPEMSVEEMEKYRQLIPLLNDGTYASNLSEEDIAKIRRVEEFDKKKDMAAAQEGDKKETPKMDDETYMKLLNDPVYMSSLSPEARADFIKDGKAPEIVEPMMAKVSSDTEHKTLLFDPKNFEKKKDKIDNIAEYVEEARDLLRKSLGIESANGIATAQVVDAVNRGTLVHANASKNLARANQISKNNRVESMPSLQSNNKSLTGVV